MNIMAQAAIVFGICLISEGISALIPVAFPASVIALLLLGLLLFTKILKPDHVKDFTSFVVANMALFFLPSCVGVMEHSQAVLGQLVPFLLINILTTPLVYFVTAWTVQWLIRRTRKKEAGKHA